MPRLLADRWRSLRRRRGHLGQRSDACLPEPRAPVMEGRGEEFEQFKLSRRSAAYWRVTLCGSMQAISCSTKIAQRSPAKSFRSLLADLEASPNAARVLLNR